TLPGVSFPSSVVRSIIVTASFSPAIFAAFLMDRLPSAAARSSTATASTGGGSNRANLPPRAGDAARNQDVVPFPFPFSCATARGYHVPPKSSRELENHSPLEGVWGKRFPK